MDKWEKLDKEFYAVVNKLTDAQWSSWKQQQNQNRMIRKEQKEEEMEIHLNKLSTQMPLF